MGGATRVPEKRLRRRLKFQSTLPVGGATPPLWQSCRPASYFNPRSPWGERLNSGPHFTRDTNFNPRSPWGERPGGAPEAGLVLQISIHAPRGGSDSQPRPVRVRPQPISIHAPRGGSDQFRPPLPSAQRYFNPRSPWGERHFWTKPSTQFSAFQSTLPVGGATR